jgi:hypothetical protein
MLDPLSALSVAGNVIQFVDFTSKLFGLTSEVYRSASGASKETEELEAIAKHLQGLCARLSQSAQSLSPQHPPDAELKELAGNCSSVGAELLKALASLKSNGTNKGWQSFRLALATTWKAKKIEALCQRLQSFRSQLILHLIAQQDAIQR